MLLQIAISYWHQRKCDETRAWARRALDLDPRHLLAREFLAGVCWQLGDLDGWMEEDVRGATVCGAPADAIAHVRRAGAAPRTVYATGGAAALARHLADPMTGQKHVGAPEKIAIQRAVLRGAAGRLDKAFESLDVALAAHEPALVHLAVAPQWDSLRAAPRFSQCLRTMALPDCRLM